ncbi:MFS transporter [Microbacterium marinilacus]|uniref:MFS transporter n=1 Tax=Microbacterium marinilacus TaxID=415209 RepID=A0ABP7B4I4_9MICO|nr:MFS transporter [Microbacterium marinilacus]MBY0687877.1 MFS transporter [Microbacterium marinilacus]
MTAEPAAPAIEEVARIQSRTVRVLAAGQVLGGVSFGATVSLGALLAADLSGQESLSGFATASVTLGAALCAIPLARLAGARGRRFALTLGNVFALIGIAVVITAAAVRSFPLLLVGVVLIGAGNAGNLQSRFAATDLAAPARRGRDLGTVVWATTVGGVLGPLMITPGEILGGAIGMPPLTGAYLFSIVAQAAALALYLVALRPDPLVLAQRIERASTRVRAAGVDADRPVAARYAMFAVAASHVVMASVMAMTPVHLSHLAVGGPAGHGDHADPTAVTLLVGMTIALHVFGMYGASPLFGYLADRIGRVPTVLVGQGLLAVSLLVAAAWPDAQVAVVVALFLLGLGWSAATVAGSALLTESTPLALRPRRQGLSDTAMTASAAVGAVLAGLVLGAFGYGVLALFALVLVAATTLLSPLGRR